MGAPEEAVAGPRQERLDRFLRQLRVTTLVAPLALVVFLELGHWLLDPILSPWADRLLVFTFALAAIAVIYDQVFRRLGALQRRLLRQNRELLGLHQAGLAVAADLSLHTVLQTVVDTARHLVGTRYGAISVVDEDNRIRSFLTSGMSAELHARIGDPPRGHGLLGVVLRGGQRLRLEDISRDPRAIGFPPHHPHMRSLLAVPVACRGPFRGNLYLSERVDGRKFSAEDEDTLVRFAAQAAIAIDNAYLHRQVGELGAAKERIRIAHEMHDGVAQVLAYVNTKAQVVREYIRQGKREAAEQHLEQLSEAARGVYGDVRAQILDLRTATPNEKGLREALVEYVGKWQRLTDIDVELVLAEGLKLPPEAELQLLRILQEALTNVRKHSAASRVRVALDRHGPDVRLLVADDGEGFDPQAVGARPRQGPRFGLQTMRERAEAVGGRLELETGIGEGTRVETRIPAAGLGAMEIADATADR